MVVDRVRATCVALALCGCGGASSNTAAPQSPQTTTEVEPSASEPAETEPAQLEDSEVGTDAAAEPVPAAHSSESPTERLMRQHFKSAESIRLAVISGKQDDIFKPARTLVYLSDVQTLPEDWQEPIARMQDAADRLKGSQDMVTAAAATADIGTSCGLCHQGSGGPHITVSDPPSSDGTVAARMRQHAWATERLWEGLYVPSDEAWNAGVALLSDHPFPQEALDTKGGYARTAAQDFAKIVAAAPHAKKTEDKANIYAQLLATCAVCHLSNE